MSNDIQPPNVFIQWKGTDACLDIRCECGANVHFDGFFAYLLRCPECHAVWRMPSVVRIERATEDDIATLASVKDCESSECVEA